MMLLIFGPQKRPSGLRTNFIPKAPHICAHLKREAAILAQQTDLFEFFNSHAGNFH
jgi:hypothetical protein